MSEELRLELQPEPQPEQISEQMSEPDRVPPCDDYRCPVQRFEEDEDEDPYISHVLVLKSGEVFYANRSIELEVQLSDGGIDVIVAIDAIDFPEKGDRSIVTCNKGDIDYTQEFYSKDTWATLMRASFCATCEQMSKYNEKTGMYM